MNADLSGRPGSLGETRDDAENILRDQIARWQQPLFRFAWRYLRNAADAEEVTIEAFVRLHEHRSQFRDRTRVSAWLFSTVANLCRNRQRWRRRHPEDPLEIPDGDRPAGPWISAECSPSEAAQDNERVAALRAAIDELPADQKTVLLLHEFQGATCGDIAPIVGCSERGVETRLYRAKRRLRRHLGRLLPER
ncbi:MAG: RNA polymerase sigma factor [Opitutaceae bacterium]